MTMPNSAMIFAAGFGKRMAAFNSDVPKPMVPIAGRPMIDHSIDLIRSAGITNIIANTHHLHDRIAPHLGEMAVRAVQEVDRILDTGGGLRAARPHLGVGPVVTLNPDVCWFGPNPVTTLIEAWQPGFDALLLLIPPVHALGTSAAGDFSLEQGEIRRNGPFIYSGAQIIRTDRLDEIGTDVFSLNAYWDLLLNTGEVRGLIYNADWCDIGTPEGLKMAEAMLADV